MPQYLAPGVYVEEVPSGIKPIEGVGTSTAGFIGEVGNVVMPEIPGKVERGPAPPAAPGAPAPLGPLVPVRYQLAPLHEPRLITSWEQFKNNFGDIQEQNEILAQSVYGFFNNGGSRCWVTRVAHGAAPGEFIEALNGFRGIDEIAIVAIPGALDAGVQEAMLSHCENEYLQDRFAIVDGQRITDHGNLTSDAIRGGLRDSSYGAIYTPWIEVFDPIKDRRNADKRRADPHAPIERPYSLVPPSGHLAGIYARVDQSRGVHKAPANELVRGATGLETVISKEEQAGLNPENVNVIRKFDGNITVWGARTLDVRDPEWRYINVRRLFLYVRESIDEGTQWVVFEPNAPPLWAQIRRNVTAFLTNVWRDGALFGATPAEAFYVKCDETTNPVEVRDLGRVIIEVGLAVVKPAEFVIFRISQWAGPGQQS